MASLCKEAIVFIAKIKSSRFPYPYHEKTNTAGAAVLHTINLRPGKFKF